MKVKKFFGDLSKRIKNFIVTLLKIGNRPEMKILPGNLAFYMVTKTHSLHLSFQSHLKKFI